MNIYNVYDKGNRECNLNKLTFFRLSVYKTNKQRQNNKYKKRSIAYIPITNLSFMFSQCRKTTDKIFNFVRFCIFRGADQFRNDKLFDQHALKMKNQ